MDSNREGSTVTKISRKGTSRRATKHGRSIIVQRLILERRSSTVGNTAGAEGTSLSAKAGASSSATAVAAAPRCMQEMCWFTPARAYALGLYIDEGALSRAVVRGAWDPGKEVSLHRLKVPNDKKAEKWSAGTEG